MGAKQQTSANQAMITLVIPPPRVHTTETDKSMASDHEVGSTIPRDILSALELRFKEIQPTMCELAVLEALDLNEYKTYLSDHYTFQMTGGGSNHKIFGLGSSGHQLEFRDFMGNFPECILHLPEKRDAMAVEIGERVSEMAGFHQYLNPGTSANH